MGTKTTGNVELAPTIAQVAAPDAKVVLLQNGLAVEDGLREYLPESLHLLGGLSGLAEAIAGGRLECTSSEERLLRTAEQRGDEFSVLSLGMERMMANIKRLLGESEEKTAAAQQATAAAASGVTIEKNIISDSGTWALTCDKGCAGSITWTDTRSLTGSLTSPYRS